MQLIVFVETHRLILLLLDLSHRTGGFGSCATSSRRWVNCYKNNSRVHFSRFCETTKQSPQHSKSKRAVLQGGATVRACGENLDGKCGLSLSRHRLFAAQRQTCSAMTMASFTAAHLCHVPEAVEGCHLIQTDAGGSSQGDAELTCWLPGFLIPSPSISPTPVATLQTKPERHLKVYPTCQTLETRPTKAKGLRLAPFLQRCLNLVLLETSGPKILGAPFRRHQASGGVLLSWLWHEV